MKKLFTLFALLIGLSVSAQTNCTCDTASTDTNQILSPYSFHFDGYKNGSTNADKVKLYVNGVKQALTFTGTFSTLYNSTTPLQIGIEGAGTALDQFNGFLNTYSFTSDTISAIE